LRPHVIIYAPRSHISDLLISQKCLGATVDIKSKNFEDYTKAKTVVVKLYKKTIKKNEKSTQFVYDSMLDYCNTAI
jgi:hypothetical protein